MAGMLLIGYFAYKRTSNLTDYMLGGRSLGPAVTALSAGAADMSGWLLMGLPGAMFSTGLSERSLDCVRTLPWSVGELALRRTAAENLY